jgi:hypothetical protein
MTSYKEGEVTTIGNFPDHNITHKPKRMQGDSLKKDGDEISSVDVDGKTSSAKSVPNVVTIERAIKYYKEHATGEHTKLYIATAKWLVDLLTIKSKQVAPKNNILPEAEGIHEINVEKVLEEVKRRNVQIIQMKEELKDSPVEE